MVKQLELTKVSGTPTALIAGTTIFDLPSGVRIKDCQLSFATGAEQQIADGYTDVRLIIADRKQRELTVTETTKIQNLFGVATVNDVKGAGVAGADPCILPVLFNHTFSKELTYADQFSLDVPPGVRAQIAIVANGSATAPSIALDGLVQPLSEIDSSTWNVTKEGLPRVEKFYRRSPAYTPNIEDGWQPGRQGLLSFGHPSTTGAITAIEVLKNGEQIFKSTKFKNDERLSRLGMLPTVDSFDIVPDVLDDPRDTWNFRSSDEIKAILTCSGTPAGNVKILSMVYGVID
jgi:hypothetical protein